MANIPNTLRQDKGYHDSQNELCRHQAALETLPFLDMPRILHQAHNTEEQGEAHNHNPSPELLLPTKRHQLPRASLDGRRRHSKLDAPRLLLHPPHKLALRQLLRHPNRQQPDYQAPRRANQQPRLFRMLSSDGRHFHHIGRVSPRTGSGD